MKNSLVFMTALLLLGSIRITTAQNVKLDDLNAFDKIILEGSVKGVDVANRYVEQPAVLVEGVKKENVSAKVEAGVLYLTITDANDVLVHVFNRRLKRIEGPSSLEVYGVDYIGDGGHYLITGKNAGFYNVTADRAMGSFDFNFDVDCQNMVNISKDVQAQLQDRFHEWKYDMEDFKSDFHYESRDLSEEIRKALRDASENLKRELEAFEN